MAGSSGKIVFLLSRMSPSPGGEQEPLPCAELTLGIDPTRTDSGVGGRLVERSAQQLDGQVERESGNKRTAVCPTLPLREAVRSARARGTLRDKEGVL
jgi:hypothetical protein